MFFALLGAIVFFLPYPVYALLLKKKRVNGKNTLLFIASSCLVFCFSFFVVMDRDFIQLVDHIIHPTVKFYSQYYALLGATFIGFPLLYYLVDKIQRIGVLKILSLVFFSLSLFVVTALFWAAARYPIDQPRTVYFVLSSPVEGGVQAGQVISFFTVVLLPVLLFSLLSCMVCWLLKARKMDVSWKPVVFLSGIILAFAVGFFVLRTKIWEYPQMFVESTRPPVFSEFYDKEFVAVDLKNLEFPQEKRNLVLIFLESMESSFVDREDGGMMEVKLIPRLAQLAKENVSFSDNGKYIGGGVDLDGTNWTIAGLLSKMGGAPFNPYFMDANPYNTNIFFPKLVTLTDVLQENGYSQRFIFGSDKGFASRDLFLESHGEVEVHDIHWYKNQGLLPKDYNVFWGFEDAKLYEYAKMELTELAASESPFFFGMLTVDTHFPEGYMCPGCVPIHGDSQIKNVIRCADEQAASFMEWLAEQPFYESTVVVILGDHCFMETDSSNLFGQSEIVEHNELGGVVPDLSTDRRWLNIFINSAREPVAENNRLFSSFDMFPTILESMGVAVPDGAGFGRSLFSGEETLLEKYGIEYVNTEIMKKATQYVELLYE